MPDSVRHLQSAEEMMRRYHADIERLVFGAEIVCQEAGGDDFRCPLGSSCAFRCACGPEACGLSKIREVVHCPDRYV